jgi:hypothetical protein
MNRVVRGTAVIAGVGAGVMAMRRIRSVQQSTDGDGSLVRWQVVTVNRRSEEVAPDGRLPEPLAQLGEAIEVQVRPAPADRGTELAARLRRGDQGDGRTGPVARLMGQDPRQDLRAALRQAKQLLETGEVLIPDRPPTTRRTVRNLPIEMATRRAAGEGRL